MSNIELFSNELLIELFGYISPDDLYNIFLNQNSRFYSIIKSLKSLHLILKEDWDCNERSVPSFAGQISTLIVEHDEMIDFSYYLNIRSLKLSMPTTDQCNAIRPCYLPNLEHLWISNFFYSDNSEQLCHLVFSPVFSRLRTFHIDRMRLHECHPYSSLTLYQLTISPCTWETNMYTQIFKACPNLAYLRIIRLQDVSFDLSLNVISLHISVQYLHVHFYSITNRWCHHIDWLLVNLPNLQNLTLLIDDDDTDINFPLDSFAHSLMQYAPNLTNFKAKIPYNAFLPKPLDAIKQLHPLFTYVTLQTFKNRDLNNCLTISSKR